jgi:hypothetical protein
VLWHGVVMIKKKMTTKQFSSVACSTCGVATGMRCLRYSGALRVEAHVNRNLGAIAAVEGN